MFVIYSTLPFDDLGAYEFCEILEYGLEIMSILKVNSTLISL